MILSVTSSSICSIDTAHIDPRNQGAQPARSSSLASTTHQHIDKAAYKSLTPLSTPRRDIASQTFPSRSLPPLPMSYSRSPISRTPLLSSAQDPGMSQRLSESSIASIANGNSQSHGMSRSGYSSVANPRAQYGPSAKLGTPSSSSQGLTTSDSSRTALGDVSGTNKLAGAGAFGMMDDDDDMDDHIHNFSAADKRNPNAMTPFDITSARGWANALTLVFLMLALVGIFALYPILSFYTNDRNSVGANASGFNLGGVNSTGQYPDIPGLPRMIDADTPDNVKSRTGFDGEEWVLVFSDEFNQEGRTFYPGDDPFWTAVDIHYWGTKWVFDRPCQKRILLTTHLATLNGSTHLQLRQKTDICSSQ